MQDLTPKQERGIAALLEQPTLRKAAASIKVTEPTLWRWLQQPDFVRAYRAARRQAVEQSLAVLQSATVEAVEALRRNLTCEKPSVEVSAAVAIIGQAVKAVELVDLEERLAALEARFEGVK